MRISLRVGLIAAFCGAALAVEAQGLDDISNYREYSPRFASSGQPAPEQFEFVKNAGFERIIYIAFSTDGAALANEDKIVRDLGLDYIHVPVVWNNPTSSDFGAFASVMQREPEKKTLLHCQVNFRASAFSFLYRVIYEGVSVAEAKDDMNSVWQPNDVWREFIFETLAAHDISPNCDGCNWDIVEE